MTGLHHHTFFDLASSTLSYVVWDGVSRDALVIDPVLDYDATTQMTTRKSLTKLIEFVRRKHLYVHWILETHVHADHLSGGRELRQMLGVGQWGFGGALREVFVTFHKVFAWPKSVQFAGLGGDRLFGDGEEFTAGKIRVQALATPGHTPACMTYMIGEWLFTGDALMMPDAGTGRCDFPGGSASALYDSLWGKLYALPDNYQVFAGHDYQPGGRPLRYRSSLGEEKVSNIHLRVSTAKGDFIAFREGRDKTLSPPKLLEPSLDWNLGAHQIVKSLKLT